MLLSASEQKQRPIADMMMVTKAQAFDVREGIAMVTTKLRVTESGDLELPSRPRRRLRLAHRVRRGRTRTPVIVRTELSRQIA